MTDSESSLISIRPPWPLSTEALTLGEALRGGIELNAGLERPARRVEIINNQGFTPSIVSTLGG
jgi:hypothetical protein